MNNSNTQGTEASSTASPTDHSSDGGTDAVQPQQPEAKPADSADDSSDDSLSLDIVFGILSNRRRQLVLKYLRDNDGEATTGELAEHIAAIENDITVHELNAQQRKRVYIGLYQSHLPKMDDVDVIDFNQSRGQISPGKHVEPLYEYLDVADENNDKQRASDGGQTVSEGATATATGSSTQSGQAATDGTNVGGPLPMTRPYGIGYAAFATVFFVAQISGAHMIASGTVVLFLLLVLVLAYRSM